MAANVENNTETLLWYENPSFAEYTAVERNTTYRTTNFCVRKVVRELAIARLAGRLVAHSAFSFKPGA